MCVRSEPVSTRAMSHFNEGREKGKNRKVRKGEQHAANRQQLGNESKWLKATSPCKDVLFCKYPAEITRTPLGQRMLGDRMSRARAADVQTFCNQSHLVGASDDSAELC